MEHSRWDKLERMGRPFETGYVEPAVDTIGMPLESDAAYRCPFCGEENYLGVDPAAGALQRLTEDCPVCCNPIAFAVRVGRTGDAMVESAEAES